MSVNQDAYNDLRAELESAGETIEKLTASYNDLVTEHERTAAERDQLRADLALAMEDQAGDAKTLDEAQDREVEWERKCAALQQRLERAEASGFLAQRNAAIAERDDAIGKLESLRILVGRQHADDFEAIKAGVNKLRGDKVLAEVARDAAEAEARGLRERVGMLEAAGARMLRHWLVQAGKGPSDTDTDACEAGEGCGSEYGCIAATALRAALAAETGGEG